jgi:hypothetical protein
MLAFWILFLVLAFALGAAGYLYLLHRDRPETRAPISQTLVLAPDRDEAKRVARALAWRLRRLPWQTRRIRTIQVKVKTKDGLSATIVQELAAILSDRNVGLSIDTDEEITLKERLAPSSLSGATAAPAAEASAALSPEQADTLPFDPNGAEKARRPSQSRTVVRNGRVLECTSTLVARNHSRIPAKLALSIPRVLRRCGKVPVACTVTIEF